MNKNRKYMRIMETVLDSMYVFFCIVIVILAILVCMKPVDNAFCYPVIFLLAALLSFGNAYTKLNRFSPTHGHSLKGYISLAAGIFLTIIMIISAISVFR